MQQQYELHEERWARFKGPVTCFSEVPWPDWLRPNDMIDYTLKMAASEAAGRKEALRLQKR